MQLIIKNKSGKPFIAGKHDDGPVLQSGYEAKYEVAPYCVSVTIYDSLVMVKELDDQQIAEWNKKE